MEPWCVCLGYNLQRQYCLCVPWEVQLVPFSKSLNCGVLHSYKRRSPNEYVFCVAGTKPYAPGGYLVLTGSLALRQGAWFFSAVLYSLGFRQVKNDASLEPGRSNDI